MHRQGGIYRLELGGKEAQFRDITKSTEWAEEKLTTEDINNKLLLGTDNKGRTAWHLAAENGNFKLLHNMWEWAEKKLTTEEINNKLL